MIVCHCEVVSSTTVHEVVRTGASTLGQVCRATGAGRGCGICVLSIKRLITDVSDATGLTIPGP